jgi:hypothetical protein
VEEPLPVDVSRIVRCAGGVTKWLRYGEEEIHYLINHFFEGGGAVLYDYRVGEPVRYFSSRSDSLCAIESVVDIYFDVLRCKNVVPCLFALPTPLSSLIYTLSL